LISALSLPWSWSIAPIADGSGIWLYRTATRSSPTLLSDVVDPIGANSRVVKQSGALGCRVVFGEPFEAIEQDVMGERYLIDDSIFKKALT
jgi:hypothetical protein